GRDEGVRELEREDGRMRSAKAGTELVFSHSLHHQDPPSNPGLQAGGGYYCPLLDCPVGITRRSVAMPPEDVNGMSGQSLLVCAVILCAKDTAEQPMPPHTAQVNHSTQVKAFPDVT